MFKCKFCNDTSARRHSVRKNKVGLTPVYFCKKCDLHFVNRRGFENFRHTPEAITAALDLRAKGLSLSDVVDHLDQHYRVNVSRVTILDWQKKFGQKLKSFSQTLTPHLGGTFHADEMFVKQRKNWIYYWDCLDYETKFLVADHLSDERNDREAVEFLKKIKCGSPELPSIVHTDCSYDYPRAFRRVFPRRRIHKSYPAWKKKFKNNPIERFHNTLKQRYKVFRGFDNIENAEKFFDFYRVYYNFIRKHRSLQMRTPAQAARIELNLGRNRIRSMIEILLAFVKARIWLKPNVNLRIS